MFVVLEVSERRASACLIMLSAKQCSHWYHFNIFGLVWRGQVSNPRMPALEADALPFGLLGPVLISAFCIGNTTRRWIILRKKNISAVGLIFADWGPADNAKLVN